MQNSAHHPAENWQHPIWLLLVILTPLFVNLWVEQQFEASKIWLARTLIWILVGLWICRAFQIWPTHPAKKLPKRLLNLIVSLALVIILSSVLSEYRTISFLGSLDRANGALTQLSFLLFFIGSATQLDLKDGKLILTMAILTAMPICLLGLAQAAGWESFSVLTDGRSSLVTTLGRANFTGAYLALLLPLTAAAASEAQQTWQKVGFKLLVALECVVILLTQARGAWVAAFVGISVFLWLWMGATLTAQARRWVAAGWLTTLTAGLAFWLWQGISIGGSIAARWTIWRASLQLLWPRLWLGYGADTLELYFPAVYLPELVYYQGRGVVTDRAHHWMLDWSLSYGVVATAIFIAIVAVVLWSNAHWFSKQPDKTQPWTAACIALVCAHLIGNLFLFDVAATALLFWFALAFLTAPFCLQPTHHPQPDRPWWGNYLIGGATATVVIVAIGWFNLRPLWADMQAWRGTQVLSQNQAEVALESYVKAAAVQPFRAEYHVAVALTAAEIGQFDQAEQAIQQAILLRPADPVLQTQLAGIYDRAVFENQSPKHIEQALATYERALELAPTIGLTAQQAADFAYRTGRFLLAQQYAAQAVDLDATDGIGFLILGWSHLQLDDPAAAQTAFAQAVRWQPNSADGYLGLATAYAEQGDIPAAKSALERSLQIDPAYTPALTLQAHLES